MAHTDDPQNKPPDSVLKIRDFGGLLPNSDPHDLPSGAAVIQVNAVALRPGELRVRGGTAVVRFDG